MAYLGRGIENLSDRVVLDALTASATASYTLQLNSVNFVPSSAESLTVSLNGVIQAPISSYTVSGSTLTFSSALTSSDSIDFIIAERGITLQTPSAGSVNTDQLAATAVTNAKIANSTIEVGKVASSLKNTPSFRARKTSNQAAAQSTDVKITFDTEDFDTDSAFADSKFTVPSGKGGKYFLNFVNRIRNAADILHLEYSFYKNGSKEDRISNVHNYISGDSQYQSYGFSTTLNLNASDYIEVYINHSAGGNLEINGGTGITIFQGFKLIGD